jgi:hypothetical protein
MFTTCRYGTIAVEFTQEEREQVAHHAENAILPSGGSKIFNGNPDQLALRERERPENQYVGMACEAAFYKWAEVMGSGGFSQFLLNRELRNQNKFQGDNGVDCFLSGGLCAVDVKGSEPPRDYSFDEDTAMQLCLTHERDMRREKMQDIVYVFAITQRFMSAPNVAPGVVLLVGWLFGHELYGREDRTFLKGWSAAGSSLRKLSTLAANMPVAQDNTAA